MRWIVRALGWALVGAITTVQAGQQNPPSAPSTPAAKAPAPQIQALSGSATETPPPAARAEEAGYMDPAAIKPVLHQVWLAEYRINDLLTQVRPERWKMADAARTSFGKTLTTLRAQMDVLEQWRVQYEKRPDSLYLGYETYVAINTVLPRLDGIARDVSHFENPSLGAQFSQAGNQLFDLQQALEPYLSYLLRNQDQILFATQSNLASCQNQLTTAMRGCTQTAKPMKNVLPQFKGKRQKKTN